MRTLVTEEMNLGNLIESSIRTMNYEENKEEDEDIEDEIMEDVIPEITDEDFMEQEEFPYAKNGVITRRSMNGQFLMVIPKNLQSTALMLMVTTALRIVDGFPEENRSTTDEQPNMSQ